MFTAVRLRPSSPPELLKQGGEGYRRTGFPTLGVKWSQVQILSARRRSEALSGGSEGASFGSVPQHAAVHGRPPASTNPNRPASASTAARAKVEAAVDDAVNKGKITPARRKHWVSLIEADPGMADVLATVASETAVPMSELGHSADHTSDLAEPAGWFY